MMTLCAEIRRSNNGNQSNYKCSVYSADKEVERIFDEYSYKNRNVTIFLEEEIVLDLDTGDTEPYKPLKIKEERITYENKKKICELILSATQTSKNKAARVINRKLGEMGYGKKIDSSDITQLFSS